MHASLGYIANLSQKRKNGRKERKEGKGEEGKEGREEKKLIVINQK